MTFKEGTTNNNMGDKTPTNSRTKRDDDATALNEDSDSTLNGSVLNLDDATAQAQAESSLTADDWLKKARPLEKHKKRRSRKDRAAAGSSSQKSASSCASQSGAGLTVGNMQQHDNAFRSALKIKLTDDESSVYSVDQDGFYTSMHLDSGLRGYIQAVIEEATATPKQGARKKPPPPPPRRQSSSLAKNTRLTQSQTSLLSLNDQ